MSKPSPFGPLNSRKPTHVDSQTVGNTYGERRQKMGDETEASNNWVQKGLQWGKDLFLGNTKKTNNINAFSNSADRYEGVRQSANAIVDKKSRLEGGYSLKGRVQQPSPDKYVGFLNSVIEYLDTRKKKV